jgi:hypothetical protein
MIPPVPVCGGSMAERRPHARYCSATCRGRASRGEKAPPDRHCDYCKWLIHGRRTDARYCDGLCKGRADAKKRAKPPIEAPYAGDV